MPALFLFIIAIVGKTATGLSATYVLELATKEGANNVGYPNT